MAGPTVFYSPPFEALRRLPLSVCAGELSHGQMARRTALALADTLAVPLIEAPGNHLGPSLEPARFAGTLKKLLKANKGR